MDLSVIIINWNTRDLLAGCLDSLKPALESWAGNWEVIVVDNASSDRSQEMLAKSYPWVLCIESRHNPGFAAANNLAIRRALGAYLLLLNADTLVRPGAVSALIDFMDQNPLAGAAGARLLNADASLQTSCFPEPTLLREFWRLFHLDRIYPLGVYDMRKWHPDRSRQVDNILGACMLLRRTAVDRVGLMDESFFMYSEEIDWCLRLRRAGWKIFWVPGAEIVHFGGQSTRQMRREMFIYLYRGKIMYFRKHHGNFSAFAYKGILAGATLARLAVSWMAYAQQPPRREENLRLASYYRQLLRSLPEM